MKYEKVVCWGADSDLQKMVTKEFKNSEIVLALTFEDFKEATIEESLNLISSANFDDLDTSHSIDEVFSFVQSRPNQEFHIIMFVDREGENGGLQIGYLEHNANVHVHLLFQNSTATIEALIDAGL